MATQSTTERARDRFTVKEGVQGSVWIMLERLDADLSVLGNGFLGFDLAPGTSMERVEEIAEFLNRNIHNVSCTQFR